MTMKKPYIFCVICIGYITYLAYFRNKPDHWWVVNKDDETTSEIFSFYKTGLHSAFLLFLAILLLTLFVKFSIL